MEKALEGIKVLDFSHLLQGPFATQMLGDMGADIIKVERHHKGDLFRSITFFNKWVGGTESPSFLARTGTNARWPSTLKAVTSTVSSWRWRKLPMSLCKISGRASWKTGLRL